MKNIKPQNQHTCMCFLITSNCIQVCDGFVLVLYGITFPFVMKYHTCMCSECKGDDKLECTITKNCSECPDFSPWSECTADCGEQGKRTRTIDEIGFPDTCPSGTEEQPCDGSCTSEYMLFVNYRARGIHAVWYGARIMYDCQL